MVEVVVLFVLALVWVIFAVVSDLRTREIPNWLNFSLIVFALAFRFFYVLFTGTGWNFFYQGLVGFGIFLVLGNLLYYGRAFAGGDARLLMALGAVLPINADLKTNLLLMFGFFVFFLFSGAVYGIFVTFIMTFKNLKGFKKEFKKQFIAFKKLAILFSLLAVLLLILSFWNGAFFSFAIFLFVLPYFYIYSKAVDEACMVRKIKPSKVTPGDWLYKDLKVGKKTIKSSWEGVSEEDLKYIKKLKKPVLIRWGIQFAPVFLIGLLLWFFVFKPYHTIIPIHSLGIFLP